MPTFPPGESIVIGVSKRQQRRDRAVNKRNTAKKAIGKRARLWGQTGGMCVYCDCEIGEKMRSLDHIWPRSRGGTNGQENLMPACRDCNTRRSSKVPVSDYVHTKWREYVRDKERAMGIAEGRTK